MLFNSYSFLFLFLPITLAGLYFLRRRFSLTAAIAWTGIASLVFYGVWDPRYLLFLIGSILVNYLCVNIIMHSGRAVTKKFWLLIGLFFNLGLLGFFKYSAFFITNLNHLLSSAFYVPQVVLPIGISFFTFTQISYLVDTYKGKARHYAFFDYLLFVTFFPHLVAGPILRHHSILPQFQSEHFGRPTARAAYIGLVFFCCGMFKKVIIADNLALYVTPLFAAQQLLPSDAWMAALLYTLQLYFDFSGYSEMALGLGLLMNVRIPLNFNSPYKATSMIDFWRRWHISLSQFLKDYVYIPLGGSRRGMPRHLLNLFITLMLCGLWHGAGWTFIVWGSYHGIMLAINHLWRKTGYQLHTSVSWGITFLAVVCGWVIFRSPDLLQSIHILKAMAGAMTNSANSVITDKVWVISLIIGLMAWVVFAPATRALAFRRNPPVWIAIVCALMLIVSIINLTHPTEFLYFQF